MSCTHPTLTFEPSSEAQKARYRQPTPRQLAVASTLSGSTSSYRDGSPSEEKTFPAPLVLPDDLLALDPDEHEPQSLREWLEEEARNEVTAERRVVYLADAPRITREVKEMEEWAEPDIDTHTQADEGLNVEPPDVKEVLEYLKAFYHGLPVRLMRMRLAFTGWDDGPKNVGREKASQAELGYLGFRTGEETVRIRNRPRKDDIFSHQLNLDDLLDAAIGMLPKDAYALLLLINHDLYEDEDDDFACGRAYGGSRVAVVSTARYNPTLDEVQNVERDHAWPASHCEEYVKSRCATVLSKAKRKNGRKIKKVEPRAQQRARVASSSNTIRIGNGKHLPLEAAVRAHLSLARLDPSSPREELTGLWLGRVCRTASHELGHCFGIAHCSWYACCMQGTASLIEDVRQPPYLCPVDAAKVGAATGKEEQERLKALMDYCQKRDNVHLFGAFAAWIRARLASIEKTREIVVID